jgi:hypothetical protein
LVKVYVNSNRYEKTSRQGVEMNRNIGLPKYMYVALAFIVAGLLFLIATTSNQPLHIYLLPDNFVGEVEITFDQVVYPPLDQEHQTYFYNIPKSGRLKTSSKMVAGPLKAYYIDNQGHRNELGLHEEFIHAVSTHSGGQDNLTVISFFVGTKEQYHNHRETIVE